MTSKQRRALVIMVTVAVGLLFSVIIVYLYDDSPEDHDWTPLLDTLPLGNAPLLSEGDTTDAVLDSNERADVYFIEASKGDMIQVAYETSHGSMEAVVTDEDGLAAATYYGYLLQFGDEDPPMTRKVALFEIPVSGRYILMMIPERLIDLEQAPNHSAISYSLQYAVASQLPRNTTIADTVSGEGLRAFMVEINVPATIHLRVWTTDFFLSQRVSYVQLTKVMYPPFQGEWPFFTNPNGNDAAFQGVAEVDGIKELMTTVELEAAGRYWIILTPYTNFEDFEGYTPDMQRRFELLIQ